MRLEGLFLALSLATAAPALAATPTGASPTAVYQLASTVGFPGKAPSWDYVCVDSSRGYLFLGRRAEGVTVYDVRAGRTVKSIEQSQKANGAVLVPEFDRGYTANGDGSTTIFQLSTLKTLGRVKLGDSADAAYYDPSSKLVIFTRGDDHLLTFMDARTGRRTGDLKMDADELEGVVADGAGAIFVSERDKTKMAKVDPKARTLLSEWDIGSGCTLPTGVGIDQAQHRLFIGCKGERPMLAVMDATNGKVVATAPIGRGNDGVVYDAAGKRVFTSNGVDGNIVIYDQLGPDSYRLNQAITTRPIARTMAYDPNTQDVYTMAAQGLVDPGKPVNTRAGAFYPNSFYDDTFTLFVYRSRPFNAAAPAED